MVYHYKNSSHYDQFLHHVVYGIGEWVTRFFLHPRRLFRVRAGARLGIRRVSAPAVRENADQVRGRLPGNQDLQDAERK